MAAASAATAMRAPAAGRSRRRRSSTPRRWPPNAGEATKRAGRTCAARHAANAATAVNAASAAARAQRTRRERREVAAKRRRRRCERARRTRTRAKTGRRAVNAAKAVASGADDGRPTGEAAQPIGSRSRSRDASRRSHERRRARAKRTAPRRRRAPRPFARPLRSRPTRARTARRTPTQPLQRRTPQPRRTVGGRSSRRAGRQPAASAPVQLASARAGAVAPARRSRRSSASAPRLQPRACRRSSLSNCRWPNWRRSPKARACTGSTRTPSGSRRSGPRSRPSRSRCTCRANGRRRSCSTKARWCWSKRAATWHRCRLPFESDSDATLTQLRLAQSHATPLAAREQRARPSDALFLRPGHGIRVETTSRLLFAASAYVRFVGAVKQHIFAASALYIV